MRTHPVFLRLEGQRCVIVGGDAAAIAKAKACLDAGAEVTVVAPEVGADVAGARRVGPDYRPGALAGAFLAYASTRDPQQIQRLAREAERGRAPLHRSHAPETCTRPS